MEESLRKQEVQEVHYSFPHFALVPATPRFRFPCFSFEDVFVAESFHSFFVL
jgi:hypothetical protein